MWGAGVLRAKEDQFVPKVSLGPSAGRVSADLLTGPPLMASRVGSGLRWWGRHEATSFGSLGARTAGSSWAAMGCVAPD